MREVRTKDAVGQVLCHDLTQTIPGVVKDTRFRKGRVATEENIPVLLSIGKKHLYIWKKDDTIYHEGEATEILCSLYMNEHMSRNQAKEDKIELRAEVNGLLRIDTELLDGVNGLGDMMIVTLHPNMPVKKGDKICGTRVVPLVIKKERMEEAKHICGGRPIFTILPYQKKKAAIVTTGSEVCHGRTEDAFRPVLMERAKEFGTEILGQTITDGNPETTTEVIRRWLEQGADMVLVSGGMSVDPGDKTPLAIRDSGVRVVSYGTPVLPGAMLLLSCYEKEGEKLRAVAGLPGCIMYVKRAIFDLVPPWLMADDMVTVEGLYRLGRGGLCMNCEVCHHPNCGFGKG